MEVQRVLKEEICEKSELLWAFIIKQENARICRKDVISDVYAERKRETKLPKSIEGGDFKYV